MLSPSQEALMLQEKEMSPQKNHYDMLLPICRFAKNNCSKSWEINVQTFFNIGTHMLGDVLF